MAKKKNNHDKLIEEAKKAIDAVISDTSVPWWQTIESLDDIESYAEGHKLGLKEEHAEDLD